MITEENKSVEVFGTKEVSVKEFMGSSDKSLVLLSDHNLAKENLEALNEKHKERVTELVAIEELSPSELRELNTCRAELREPRYLIQNIEKNNISVFESYKKTDKANLKQLIDINRDLEDKASEKIKLEEERKKLEKEAEAKAEENRIAKIKSDIDNIETYCSEIVQKMTFENIKVSAESIDQSLNAEYDFEEYDILFDQVKGRVTKLLLDKTNDITARENQRLENERMKQEIFDVRVNRLKEVGFNLVDSFFVSKTLDFKLGRLAILDSDSATFEQTLSGVKSKLEKLECDNREAEIKREKDEQFEVRKNRLVELYPNYNFDVPTFSFYGFTNKEIYDADIVTFETIMQDAKKSIQEAKEQKELADKKAIADKNKADAENKARVKRLAKDKEVYKEILNNELGRFPIVFDSDQEEIKQFSIECSNKVTDLLNELLTQLNDL